MSRNMGLRQRIYLNAMRQADYKSLRYSEARENRRIGWLLFAAVGIWMFVMVVWS